MTENLPKPAPHELVQYIELIASLMGLGDWKLKVQVDDLQADRSGNDATIGAPDHNRFAIITFDQRWRDWDADRLREVVVHELVHAHLEHAKWAALALEHVLDMQAYDVYSASLHGTLEMVTDRIAMSWAALMPMPLEVMHADS